MMPVSPFMGGPVRYRAHMSPLAGALLGAWQDDNSLQFCTYKLYLLNIEVRGGGGRGWCLVAGRVLRGRTSYRLTGAVFVAQQIGWPCMARPWADYYVRQHCLFVVLMHRQ
jgi:hypothetical protein